MSDFRIEGRFASSFRQGFVPFGKHRGLDLQSVPLTYRNWLRAKADEEIAEGNDTWTVVKEALASFDVTDAFATRVKAEAEVETTNSQHVGEIGQRITKTLTRFDTVQGDEWTLKKLKDEAGNVYSTFGVCNLQQGQTAEVTFTVKGHREYKGVKSTDINRMKVLK